MSEAPDFFVRFHAGPFSDRSTRLEALREVFAGVKELKAAAPGGQTDLDDTEMKELCDRLPEAARATFRESPPEHAWLPEDGLVEPRWDLASMFDVLLDCEHHLLEVREEGDDVMMTFDPLAHPYGGIGSLIRFGEAFGLSFTDADDGGPVTRAEWLHS